MALRRKGRPVTGWVIIDKPAGVTSTAVVNEVRRLFEAQKAGHAGTLDPAATGVLAVALGEATKTVPFVTEAEKAYRFVLRWGVATDTDDADGAVIATSSKRPTRAEIEAALPAFRGEIMQVPPQVSAVKVQGERAYDLAREGIKLELAARPLHVAKLELLQILDPDHAEFEMICGKGGYVRALARDLGQALGSYAHVAALRRTWSGPFHADDAMTPQALAALPLEAADLPEVRLTPDGFVKVKHGTPGPCAFSEAAPGETAWASFQGRAVAVGTYMGGMLHPSRVFVTDHEPL